MFALQEAGALAMAIDRHIQTSKFDRMPTPGELHEVLIDVREGEYLSEKRRGYGPPDEPADGMTGRPEWELNASITVAILDLHHAHHPAAIRQKSGYSEEKGHPSMEQWMAMGRPRTWSSLIDEYLGGLADIWTRGRRAIVVYQHDYLERLLDMQRAIQEVTA
jgi:hypothetical protein